MSGPAPEHEPAGAAWREVAWCGLHLPVPASYRPCQVRGDTERGALVLGTAGAWRLSVRWAAIRRGPHRLEALVRRGVLGGARRARRRRLESLIQAVPNDDLAPLLALSDAEGGTTRAVGYAQASGRLVELQYRHGPAAESEAVRRVTFGGLRDQSPAAPQRWALFDLSFVAPAGLRYERSTLNVGDMAVRLGGPSASGWRRTAVGVRHIYPADLALKRQPLSTWLDRLLGTRHRDYARPRSRWGRAPAPQPLSTALGEGLRCDGALRPALCLLRWRTPRRQRHWLLHDAAHNRLILLEAADQPARLDGLLEALLEGMYWAQRPEAAPGDGRQHAGADGPANPAPAG